MNMPSADETRAIAAPKPSDESERIAALRRYRILDTPRDSAFDDLARLAAEICQAPIAVINFIDENRQWFKSEIGLGVRETPLDVSICAHAILQRGLFVVPDTTKDQRFARNPLVIGEPRLRFYAGALLESGDRRPLGTLCVLDYVPRDLSGGQRAALRILAQQVMTQLELRLSIAEKEELLAQKEFLLREVNHRVKNSLQLVSSLLSLQGRNIADGDASGQFAEAARRVQTIAQIHERLYNNGVGSVELAGYLRGLCSDLARSLGDPAVRVDAARFDMPLDKAVPLAMAVNELVTNAAKYAYSGGRTGDIVVRFAWAGGEAELEVVDQGVGLPPGFDPDQARSLGMSLVRGAAQQLDGALTFGPGPGGRGCRVRLRFPLAPAP